MILSITQDLAKQICKLTSSIQILHYKPSGRKLLFMKDELDEWITQGRVKPLSELGNETLGLTV